MPTNFSEYFATLTYRKVLRFWIGNDDFCEACKQFQYKDRPHGMVRSFFPMQFSIWRVPGSKSCCHGRGYSKNVLLPMLTCVWCVVRCRFCRMAGSVTAWVWVWWLYITLSFLMSIHNLPGGYEVPGGLRPKTILSNKQFLHRFTVP